ncbi:aldehyde dehydrogenase family protein [Celeribacter litoreus]|uniref:aldehyde dehydrogenase family protein n=1 Tax=Celeribacter litoreus TaxID=2876714 RepID=UPI001CD00154|nr:aldehyde dehydrogenase family protein [Celeribacter litoreus]MCA0043396.1 aldehyde dehydrogenase family protein [Celeribacter litoreus]
MYKLFINGELVEGAKMSPVLNPATEEPLADCPRASKEQLDDAVAAAKAAFPAWAGLTLAERQDYLSKLADVIDAHTDELARLMTQEQGKVLAETTGEVMYSAMLLRYNADRDIPVQVIEDSDTRKVELYRKPLGVVATITPWNFPLVTPIIKAAPALLAGNTVVSKPAPTTPLTLLRFIELAKDVLPAGVFNVIVDENDLGAALVAHPDVAKISFTGSTETGKKVMASAAETVKRVTLELGGNDAAIVLDDSDPKVVAPGLFAKAFVNTGQVCVAIKRIYAPETIYDELCDELATLAKDAIVDDGLSQGTTMGPVQNKMQYEKLKGFLEDAHANGTIIAGGAVMDRPGYFIEPTVVRDISEGSRLVDEEQFGPIVPVIKYESLDDAVERANATSYGLGASVWTSNRARGVEVANKLVAGSVWVNKHDDAFTHIPFGGAKQSGVGVDGIEEYTQLTVINS